MPEYTESIRQIDDARVAEGLEPGPVSAFSVTACSVLAPI